MDRQNALTGQVIFRESSEKIPGQPNDKRRLMMIVGVVAVPKHFNLKGEHKYTIAAQENQNGLMGLYQMVDPNFGRASPELKELNITLFTDSAEDVSEITQGQASGGLFTSGELWRV